MQFYHHLLVAGTFLHPSEHLLCRRRPPAPLRFTSSRGAAANVAEVSDYLCDGWADLACGVTNIRQSLFTRGTKVRPKMEALSVLLPSQVMEEASTLISRAPDKKHFKVKERQT